MATVFVVVDKQNMHRHTLEDQHIVNTNRFILYIFVYTDVLEYQNKGKCMSACITVCIMAEIQFPYAYTDLVWFGAFILPQ